MQKVEAALSQWIVKLLVQEANEHKLNLTAFDAVTRTLANGTSSKIELYRSVTS